MSASNSHRTLTAKTTATNRNRLKSISHHPPFNSRSANRTKQPPARGLFLCYINRDTSRTSGKCPYLYSPTVVFLSSIEAETNPWDCVPSLAQIKIGRHENSSSFACAHMSSDSSCGLIDLNPCSLGISPRDEGQGQIQDQKRGQSLPPPTRINQHLPSSPFFL